MGLARAATDTDSLSLEVTKRRVGCRTRGDARMFQSHGEGSLSGRAPSQGRSGIMLPDARCKEGGAERTEPIHSVHRFRPK